MLLNNLSVEVILSARFKEVHQLEATVVALLLQVQVVCLMAVGLAHKTVVLQVCLLPQ